VLVAIALGAGLGAASPAAGAAMRPVADTFINLVRMVIAPIIFLTIVHGIAGSGDLSRAGRVGVRALIYFEVVSTVALAIGLVVVNVLRPGAGLDPAALAAGAAAAGGSAAGGSAVGGSAVGGAPAAHAATTTGSASVVDLLTHIVPASIVDAFARGDVIQVVFVAVLAGAAIGAVGAPARPVLLLVESASLVVFRLVGWIMRLAPIGAFAAIAYTVGAFGLRALGPLARLMGDVYLAMAVFVFVVLGAIARLAGFRLTHLLAEIRDEIVLVLGTSSSEPALPGLMDKLERFGCAPRVVRLVVPAGYSFNLDGTAIYLSMAVLFIAQVYGIHLTVGQQLETLGILMLTSKGAAGVTGSGFLVLTSTIGATGLVPVAGVALLLGVDRFMSEARAIVNVIGNAVATVVIARSDGAYSPDLRPVGPRRNVQ
jgi:aerobic C4-dicarboxylate transport protein